MVLAVHTKLGRAAAAGHDNSLVCAGFHQSRRLNDSMGRRRTEAPGVRACGVHKSCHLCCRLCEVAAASLVHIAAGLLRTVDDVLHVLLFDARVADRVEERQHAGRLAHQVLVHHVGRQVLVNVVGGLHTAHQFSIEIQSFCMLFIYKLLDLGELHTLVHSFQNLFCDHRIFCQRFLMGCDKSLLQSYHLEHVAGLHKEEELFLRHDLAKFSVAVRPFHLLVVPGEFHFRQLLRMDVADVGLVGPVGYRLLI